MYCKECGASVTREDRFCPACGTPNVLSKFHPKLDRSLRVVDPAIDDTLAPAGSPDCPRCHRPIRRPDEYCRACGMSLDAAWERLERLATTGVWTTPGPYNLDPYRPASRFAIPLQAVLTVGFVAATAVTLLNLGIYFRFAGAFPWGPTTAELGRFVRVADAVAAGLLLLGGVLVIAWMNRSYRNLPALAVTGLRFRPFWAIAGWFVPVFNLFRPKQIMDDLWRASHPKAPPLSSSWRVGPSTAWTGAWWAGLLLGLVLAAAGNAMMPNLPTEITAPRSADLNTALVLAGAGAALLAGAALSLQLLVRRITDRQSLRAETLGAPMAVRRFARQGRSADAAEGDADAAALLASGDNVSVLVKEPTAHHWGKY